MYEERRDSFTIKDIIIQVACIILFVCLLLLLFPTTRYIKKVFNGKKDVKTEQVTKVNASDKDIDNLDKDDVFKSNITKMKDSALNYYTEGKLPKNNGEENTITLNQMYEKNLLDTLFDGNGNMCDGKKSYATAKNTGDAYQIKINLVCDKTEDSIVVNLGEYEYCNDSKICELQVDKNSKIEKTNDNSCIMQENESIITVYFITDGGTQVEKIKFVKNTSENKLNLPKTTKDGYKFDGWYNDSNYSEKLDIKSTLSEDISKLQLIETFPIISKEKCSISKNYVTFVYAKWEEINNKKDDDKTDKNDTTDKKDNTDEGNVIEDNDDNNIINDSKVEYCEYKRVIKRGFRDYNEWSNWTTKPITESKYYQVQTKVVNNKKYYRSRSRVYVWGTTQIHWSICDDQNLLNEGFVLTGKRESK